MREWLLFAFAGLAIVTIWQEYLLSAITFAWMPTWVDATSPFVLGFVEAVAIGKLKAPLSDFVPWAVLLGFSGIVAYWNYWTQAQSGLLRSPDYARFFRRSLLWGLVIISAGTVLYVGVWWLAVAVVEPGSAMETVLAGTLLLPIVGLLVRAHMCWNRRVTAAKR